MSVAGGGDVNGVDRGHVRRAEFRLDVAVAAVIPGSQHHTAARPELPRRAPFASGFDTDHALPFSDEAGHAGFYPDVYAQAPAIAHEVVREGARVWHDVMHARLAMRRLRHRADEHDSKRHQPVDGFVGVLDQDAPQREVVPRCKRTGETSEILEMRLRRVLDAGPLLVRG